MNKPIKVIKVGNSAGMPRLTTALSRDSGGSVSAGQPYYVGTGAQPELFVPSSSGSMVPNGGGGTQTINLVVDGRVLASIVNQHNSRDLLQGRLIQ